MRDPVDELLDGVGETERLAARVDQHLDEHPLPVDEAEVEAAVRRLQARLQPRRSGWRPLLAVGTVTLLAASLLLATRSVETVPVRPTDEPAALQRVALPERPLLSVEPVEEATCETVDLLQWDGPAGQLRFTCRPTEIGGEPVRENRWVVGPPEAPVVFRDGDRPPPEAAPHAETLRRARYERLPAATLDQLERLLEDR